MDLAKMTDRDHTDAVERNKRTLTAHRRTTRND